MKALEKNEFEETDSIDGDYIKIKNMNEVQINKNGMNKNSSQNLNGNNSKNSINSQKSSDRDSL